jgi:hypothetical protein
MKRWLLPAAVVAVIVGLFVFEPWTLFTDQRVEEAAPTAAPVDGAAPDGGPTVVSEGTFVKQEHATSGTATLLQLADGSHVVRLAKFATSNGPDLHVWLSEAPAGGDWFKYDEARSVPLGPLKANTGNHNYAVPADADLDGIRSVVIWCDRFNVAFGSAPLR